MIVALTIIPPAAHILMGGRIKSAALRRYLMMALIVAGLLSTFFVSWWVGAIVAGLGVYKLLEERIPANYQKFGPYAASAVAVLVVGVLLTDHWLPLGPEKGMLRNLLFVGLLIGGLLGFFTVFQRFLYEPLLRWCLAHKLLFLSLPALILLLGGCSWLGFDRIFAFVPKAVSNVGVSESTIRESRPWVAASAAFPGLGKEFMPPLDEGSFLYMPTTMPHASIGEAFDVLQLQNKMLVSIPEVESVVGKIGRADSPLDPAPISMIETFISYKSEYKTDLNGNRLKFRYDVDTGEYVRDKQGALIEESSGRPFRQWRDEIQITERHLGEDHRSRRHPRHDIRPQAATHCRSYRDVAERDACSHGHEDQRPRSGDNRASCSADRRTIEASSQRQVVRCHCRPNRRQALLGNRHRP